MSTILESRFPEHEECPSIDDPDVIAESYEPYSTDESRLDGSLPRVIYFPENTAQLSTALRRITSEGSACTIAGARTGIVGGAVSNADNLIVLEKMKSRIEYVVSAAAAHATDAPPLVRVSAGVTLDELAEALQSMKLEASGAASTGASAGGAAGGAEARYFYPIDPTETTASVGGTVATNASGARTLSFGPTRHWVEAITVVLADGSVLDLNRGEFLTRDGSLVLVRPEPEEVGSAGTGTEIQISAVKLPETKHNAGYHLTDPLDAVDLFIGSEGTLGIVSEATLRVVPVAPFRLLVTLFAPSEIPIDLITDLLGLGPRALEYMDSRSISLLRKAQETELDGGAVPPLPDDARETLYVELDLANEDELDEKSVELDEILGKYGLSIDDTWAGFERSDMEEMKRFRHALPERVNSIIAERKRSDPGITKIGTDMAVPISALEEMRRLYRSTLEEAGLEYCMFGHIGDGHLHVNVLPRSVDEYRRGYELYYELAGKAVGFGGSVSAEHGIGRLKKKFLAIQYDAEEIESMRTVKRGFDPAGRLNPGVLFD